MSKIPEDIRFYNTLNNRIEEFSPIEEGKVSLYTCGPTVYHYAHIGNLRTYIFEDVLSRTLRHAGYDVTHVMNITDVGHLQSDGDTGEDKMSVAAAREKKDPWKVAEYYEGEFFRHAGMLGIRPPDIVCRATDHIPEMIEMVSTLVDKGMAYESDGNVYFDVASFPTYAELANLKMDRQLSTDRVEIDDRKRNQADFALWFSQSKFPNQIMQWESPWGVGFPGWHIECSAMATKYLGERIDIHCGGIDHVPVHHTNEIAQAEATFGHKWVNTWMHGEFLVVDNGKMSKSKGDTLTIDKLVKDGFDPLAYRYQVLTSHYRKQLQFSYPALEGAQSAYEGLLDHVARWKGEASAGDTVRPEATAPYANAFWSSLRNDLHTPGAIATLWKAAKSTGLNATEKLCLAGEFDSILCLDLMAGPKRTLTPEHERIMAERDEARLGRNWQRADALRAVLTSEKVEVQDQSYMSLRRALRANTSNTAQGPALAG